MIPGADLNCDMGEGLGNDAALMPYLTSINIACGFHAGNSDTIGRTIDLALPYGVRIGAHPSFPDRENFGRKEMHLPPHQVYEIIMAQLKSIALIARQKGAVLHHVKPHGALYNRAARKARLAQVVAQAVKDFDENLILYGQSGSFLISRAQALGLKTASEVFADRTYRDDGSLTPRSEPGALIEDEQQCVRQLLQMLSGSVTTTSGRIIPVVAETICIHSDGKNALNLAKAVKQTIEAARH